MNKYIISIMFIFVGFSFVMLCKIRTDLTQIQKSINQLLVNK